MNKCQAVVRGKHYASIKEAAAANGRNVRQAFRHLARYGHLDFLGLDICYERPDARKAVQIAHLSFPSVSAAAEVLGVSRKTIRNAKTNATARDYVMRAAMRYTREQENQE